MTAPTQIPVLGVPGANGYVYINTGTHSTPVWVLIDNIQDVDLGDSINLFKASIRRMAPFNVYQGTMRDWNPKFKSMWIPTDTLILALIIACNAWPMTALDICFLDGLQATTGSQGPRADWLFEGFPRNEHMDEGMLVDLSLKPALTANKPVWMVN